MKNKRKNTVYHWLIATTGACKVRAFKYRNCTPSQAVAKAEPYDVAWLAFAIRSKLGVSEMQSVTNDALAVENFYYRYTGIPTRMLRNSARYKRAYKVYKNRRRRILRLALARYREWEAAHGA